MLPPELLFGVWFQLAGLKALGEKTPRADPTGLKHIAWGYTAPKTQDLMASQYNEHIDNSKGVWSLDTVHTPFSD